jgi:DNA-directed RNA polymerase subunit RPC12/RpoP
MTEDDSKLSTSEATEAGWRTVSLCENLFEANLAVNKLRDNGINARVDSENLYSLQYWALIGPGGTPVQVLADDLDAAKQLLAEVDQARQKRRQADIVRCPRCNAPAKRVWHPLRKLAVVLIVAPVVAGWILLGNGIQMPTPIYLLVLAGALLGVWSLTPRWRCPQCGNRWVQQEPEESSDAAND